MVNTAAAGMTMNIITITTTITVMRVITMPMKYLPASVWKHLINLQKNRLRMRFRLCPTLQYTDRF